MDGPTALTELYRTVHVRRRGTGTCARPLYQTTTDLTILSQNVRSAPPPGLDLVPVWWRRAVLPSLPWVVCFLSEGLYGADALYTDCNLHATCLSDRPWVVEILAAARFAEPALVLACRCPFPLHVLLGEQLPAHGLIHELGLSLSPAVSRRRFSLGRGGRGNHPRPQRGNASPFLRSRTSCTSTTHGRRSTPGTRPRCAPPPASTNSRCACARGSTP